MVLRCKGSDLALVQCGVEQSRALVLAMQEAQHQFFEQLAQRTGLTVQASDQPPLRQLEG